MVKFIVDMIDHSYGPALPLMFLPARITSSTRRSCWASTGAMFMN